MISEAIQATTVYFARPGRDNTGDALQLAKKRADELGIKTIIVATTGGDWKCPRHGWRGPLGEVLIAVDEG